MVAITVASVWRQIWLQPMIRTEYGHGFRGTVTHLLSATAKSKTVPTSGSAVSKACLTRGTCPIGPASSSPCHQWFFKPTKDRNSRPVYTLKDDSCEELRGKWYPEEIQQIRHDDYEVERVLKRRTAADGTRELFVKWRDDYARYNSWISEQYLSK